MILKPNQSLDITSEKCPMTFVKTKLALERMGLGEVLEVFLQGKEPLENVPRSVRDYGYNILHFAPEAGEDPTVGRHRLVIEKSL